MGLLGFGKKKKAVAVSKDVNSVATVANTGDIPIPSSESSDNLNPIPLSDSPSSSLDVPSPDISSSDSLDSLPLPDTSADIPSPDLDMDVSSPNSNIDPVSLDPILNQEEPIPLSDSPSSVPVESSSVNVKPLPDFSEDDFSLPSPPKAGGIDSSVNDLLVHPASDSSDDSESKSDSFIAKEDVFIQSPPKSIKPSSLKRSYAGSQGVFVHRSSYVSLLDSLSSSLLDVKNLLSKEKHLVDFDTSTSRLLNKESLESEKLHKSILAVVPFISKE